MRFYHYWDLEDLVLRQSWHSFVRFFHRFVVSASMRLIYHHLFWVSGWVSRKQIFVRFVSSTNSGETLFVHSHARLCFHVYVDIAKWVINLPLVTVSDTDQTCSYLPACARANIKPVWFCLLRAEYVLALSYWLESVSCFCFLANKYNELTVC